MVRTLAKYTFTYVLSDHINGRSSLHYLRLFARPLALANRIVAEVFTHFGIYESAHGKPCHTIHLHCKHRTRSRIQSNLLPKHYLHVALMGSVIYLCHNVSQ